MISQQAVQRYDVGRAERWLGARDVGDLDPRAAVGQCDLIRRVEHVVQQPFQLLGGGIGRTNVEARHERGEVKRLCCVY